MLWLTLWKLRSKNADTRAKALAAALRRRDLGALLQVVDDTDPYLRGDTIKALGEIGDVASVPALIRRLEDENFNNQECAAVALARIGDNRATQPLVTLLRATKAERQTRNAAAEALRKLGDPRSVPGLILALGDHDRQSRLLALRLLTVLGDTRAVPAIIAALRDSDADIRGEAVVTLAALKDARAVDALLDLLAPAGRGSMRPEPRGIIWALGEIGDARAAPALEAWLGDSERNTRQAAARALCAIGWQPPNDAVRERYDAARLTLEELASLGWDKARTPLLELLNTGDAYERREAVTVLARIGDRRTIEPLVTAVRDTDDRVIEAAAAALAAIGDARAVDPLIDYCARYTPEGRYLNDPLAPNGERDRAARWIRPLAALVERETVNIAAKDLRRLAELEDRVFHLRVDYDTPGYGYGADNFSVVLDYSPVRDLAAKELRRRGRVA
jgi:HEAT repeat protein